MKLKSFLTLCAFFMVSYLNAGPYIVLKLDDIYAKKGESPVLPVLDFLAEYNIKSSLGMIAALSDTTASRVLAPYINAKDNKGQFLVEIWNHGYDHRKPEFKGTDYDYQSKHFVDATRKIETLLNIEIHTFGAPFNAMDSVTGRIISENANYKTVFLADKDLMKRHDIVCLNNLVRIERDLGKPDFDFFIKKYKIAKDRGVGCMVLQVHPNLWDEHSFQEFKYIIKYLQTEECIFILPSEWSNIIRSWE
ncbi:DUF2334 domain-containing protein [Bacteroides sp.]|uniref:DUF2334 domain-containing protein n=1 Tax=Bacteroides sp. TaxID=29523 RepID=UPI002582F884|nr:DUF2334 domain-containing protein [Bacteroides sp.]